MCNPPCENNCVCKAPQSCSCVDDFETPVCGNSNDMGNKKGGPNGSGMKCPDGKMEHMGNCMAPEKMPCMFEGQTFEPGSEMRKECGSCKCENAGKWNCTNEGCAARCEVYGDPHHKTFDGLRFDFMGKCSYYMMRAETGMDIMVENGDCPRKYQKKIFFEF